MTVENTIKRGDTLPPLRLAPVDRTTLALYAGASGDHNPIHIDIDAARRAGFSDVFAHGMLGMAWLGRLVTQWVPQERLRELKVRFTAMTHVADVIVCSGHVVEEFERDGTSLLRIELSAATDQGNTTIFGEAVITA